MTSSLDSLKLFVMTNQLLEHDLDRVEGEQGIDLARGHRSTIDADEAYYPQIESDIRSAAAQMAPHYEMFYSLEVGIRRLISETLEGSEGEGWWEAAVPEEIRKNATKARQRELDSGTSPRSDELIDFTTFGELGQIINSNWAVFGALFSSQRAVERVMSNLNTVRGPIAHCSFLSEDEVLRLRLAVRDWFRLME
jgi:Swt1-like HEPN